ncbi:MAG: Inner membrane protein YbhL [Hyphomicrobiaceae bacterium hypho_1]
MSQFNNRYAESNLRTQQGVVDAGLRSYMLGVYNYMTLGVALTGVVAYIIYTMMVTTDSSQAAATLKDGTMLTQLGYLLMVSPLKWVVMLMPLLFILVMSFARMSSANAQIVFWAFAAVMGVSISSTFVVFNLGSIFQIFFITAAAFASLSLYGYTTKKDLSGLGSFLIMGLVGLFLAGIVNIFLQASALQFAILVIGVLVFAGLTAYDTQRIKDEYYLVAGDREAMAKASIFGALTLYLDFVNMFMMLLQLLGDRE